MKYLNTRVTFLEIPDEISLCINITGCPHSCRGCHSPILRSDTGEELTADILKNMIEENTGITCVCFMGGDASLYDLYKMAMVIKTNYPSLKLAWYSGRATLLDRWNFLGIFDYIKLGSYQNTLGGLDSKTTNQRLYKIEDITYKFLRHETNN